MYNLRYHIASLVGVFLALALGLVLGGLVVQRGTLDRQQGSLIEGLQKEFADLRAENEELAAANVRQAELSSMLTDEWIADRLVGKNVIVLSGSGRTDGTQAAADAVSAAGGTPIAITLVEPDLLGETETLEALLGTAAVASADATASITASLAAEWRGPTTERPVTEALTEAGVLTVDGLEPGMATVGLINLAASQGSPDETAFGITLAYAGDDALVIGAESPTLNTGVAQATAQRGLSGVDTVGTSLGRYSLVALLSGADPGLYGVADDAVAAFPAPPRD